MITSNPRYLCFEVGKGKSLTYYSVLNKAVPVAYLSNYFHISQVIERMQNITCGIEKPDTILFSPGYDFFGLSLQQSQHDQSFNRFEKIQQFLSGIESWGLTPIVAENIKFGDWEHSGKRLAFLFNSKRSFNSYPLSATIIVLD